MSDGALRDNVIAALKAQPGVSATEMADGTVEVSKVGGTMRRLTFGAVVSRGTLWNLGRWYGVPIEACYPSTATKPQTDAASE